MRNVKIKKLASRDGRADDFPLSLLSRVNIEAHSGTDRLDRKPYSQREARWCKGVAVVAEGPRYH